jgi:hypothetical protein
VIGGLSALRCSAVLAAVASCFISGCDPGPLGSNGGEGGAPAGGAGGGTGTDIAPAAAGRVVRLSHAQWENSVRDLLRLDAPSGLSATFPMEASGAGYLFDNPADALQVEQSLWGAYGPAAATLAQIVTSSSTSLARIVASTGGDEAVRARAFVIGFGQRAFRRPLSEGEITSYLELYADGRAAYDDATGFVGGLRLVIEAMLQSPYFLYRIETSSAIEAGRVVLSDWEISQRLSYFLTNSMPDDELFAAASAGQLRTAEGVELQVARLLAEPAAQAALGHFHDQLLNLPAYTGIAPSPVLFPQVSSELGSTLLASTRALLGDLVFAEEQGFAELMTTTRAFVNADLARLYGVPGRFDSALVPVELPADERRGLFTQAGFLAANATGVNPDPIHRGVFIAKRILCRSIAAPPNNVTPPPPSGIGTNRQIVEEHTQSRPGCASCHEQRINPYGFVFENYDAVGAYRTIDNELPVNAAAAPMLDGETVPVDDALGFATALATSREAHDCFARHLFEYALGRNATGADQPMILSLGQASLGGRSIVELVSSLALSPAFLQRSAEEAE